MGDTPDDRTEADALAADCFGKATIEVHVDLASLRVPARVWGKARAGDTLMLSLKAPFAREPLRVVLRVGDEVVAHGELCNIDGCVGVKLHEPPSTSASGPRRV